jgi:hypothetical protein
MNLNNLGIGQISKKRGVHPCEVLEVGWWAFPHINHLMISVLFLIILYWRLKNYRMDTVVGTTITLVVLVWLTIAMVNLAMTLYTAAAASQAVDFCARPGSMVQNNAIERTVHTAQVHRDPCKRRWISKCARNGCGRLGSAKLHRKSDNLHRRRRSDELSRHCPFFILTGRLVRF